MSSPLWVEILCDHLSGMDNTSLLWEFCSGEGLSEHQLVSNIQVYIWIQNKGERYHTTESDLPSPIFLPTSLLVHSSVFDAGSLEVIPGTTRGIFVWVFVWLCFRVKSLSCSDFREVEMSKRWRKLEMFLGRYLYRENLQPWMMHLLPMLRRETSFRPRDSPRRRPIYIRNGSSKFDLTTIRPVNRVATPLSTFASLFIVESHNK